MSRYDLTAVTVADVLVDPDVRAIVERFRPGLADSDDVRSVSDLPVEQALMIAQRYAQPGELEAARAELEAL